MNLAFWEDLVELNGGTNTRMNNLQSECFMATSFTIHAVSLMFGGHACYATLELDLPHGTERPLQSLSYLVSCFLLYWFVALCFMSGSHLEA